MINKMDNDNSLNALINEKMTINMYDVQNNLNFDHCQKNQISYIGI